MCKRENLHNTLERFPEERRKFNCQPVVHQQLMLLHQAWGGGRAEQQAGYPPGGPSPPRDDHVGVAENQLAALRLEEYPFLTGTFVP